MNDNHSDARREFLIQAGVATAVAVAATKGIGLADAAAPAPAASYLTSKDTTTDPLYVSATKMAQMIREKQITAVDAVKACYARIDQVNPSINAVVAFCRDRALAEAKLADEALAAGKILGPLHGVPFTIKDSFDTEGVVSTGGTLGRKDFIPGKDATIVARVRKAGGILLGKTNTPEFTLGGGARGTYNLVYGQTYNPYKAKYNPSGSSGGAGAIVAAGGAYFDLGSDYGGSIRGPAFANGITGIKPTYGRSPRTGHIVGYGGAFDNFQETGPLARRVEDLYLLLGIIGGPDAADGAMAPVLLGDPGKVDLKKLRIAYYTTDGFNPVNDPTPQIQDLIKQSVGYFSSLGAKTTMDRPPHIKELAETRMKYSNADGGDHMRVLLKKHGTLQASPGLNEGDGVELPSADFTRLLEEMDAMKSEQLAWLAQYDLIVCPAAKEPAQVVPPEFKREPGAGGGGYTSEYNTTGWPGGVVRMGASPDGLPIGVQVVGQPWRDDVVIAALSFLESKSGGWQKPPI
jgi:amidase